MGEQTLPMLRKTVGEPLEDLYRALEQRTRVFVTLGQQA
jgi:hypothetical protein